MTSPNQYKIRLGVLPNVMIGSQVCQALLEQPVEVGAETSGKELFRSQLRDLVLQVVDLRLQQKELGPVVNVVKLSSISDAAAK